MSKRLFILLLAVLLFIMGGCGGGKAQNAAKICGCKVKESEIVEYIDTHGGFHNDGALYIKAVFDEKRAEAFSAEMRAFSDCKELPMSENADIAIYGSENYGSYFAESDDFPTPAAVSQGIYRFIDRHSQSVDSSDDSELHSRSSYNFDVCIFDEQNRTLYIYRLDT